MSRPGPRKGWDWSPVADEAVYRAAFLRMHPTGKAVLSLSEASQGTEAELARIAADELGIPPEDVKVVHEDTDRFGEGNSYNSGPSDAVAENAAAAARKVRDKAALIAAWMLEVQPDALKWEHGHWSAGENSVKIQAVAQRAFGADSLPDGVEGSLDGQTTYRLEAAPA